ncbi:MAG: hypothetical protein GY735_02370 [Delftia sp.]|nr:hypothetical protein [Delftia sp.]
MKYTNNSQQRILFSWEGFDGYLPKDHRLVKMADILPWEEMIVDLEKTYSIFGRKGCSIRMMLGLEMAKRELGLSDEKIVEQLSTDAALQYFCGFTKWHQEKIPNPAVMTYFRKRLTDEILEKLEIVVTKSLQRFVPKRKRGQVIVDTTCQEANITFPTDTKLLKKTWIKLVNVAKQVRNQGKDLIIRGKQKLKKQIRGFDLKKQKTKKEIQKMRKKLLRETQKLYKKINTFMNKKIKNMNHKVQTILGTAKEIIDQQAKLIRDKTNRIKDRIISFHEPKARAIVRGKEGKKVEFGSKFAISVLGGKIAVSHNWSNNNFSDTEMIESSLKTYGKIRKRPPKELIADRGGHSPKNHDLLQNNNIRDGIEYRGKTPQKANLPPKRIQKRMKNQRSVVEGKIGTYKMRGNRCKYALKNTQTWISIGLLTMNTRWASQRI